MNHSPRSQSTDPSQEMPAALTPRQLEILRSLHTYRLNHGCSPTLREIAAQLQISRVTVFGHVESLVQKGLLLRLPNKARSLTINPKMLPRLKLADDNALAEAAQPGSKGLRFPLRGTIAAGQPLDAAEEQEMLDIGELLNSDKNIFALEVQGDSMIEEQIRPGDYVLADRDRQAHNGEIVVALLEDGETTLKKFYRDNNRIRLEPANKNYPTIYPRQLEIQGVVIGVFRSLICRSR